MDETCYRIAVIMRHTRLDNRWVSEKWEASAVVEDVFPGVTGPREIARDGRCAEFLYPGFELRLHRDEAENYFLNIGAPEPRVFVLWRMHEAEARPEFVTVSYGEAARWMDSNEQVDGVPMPAELLPWLSGYVAAHYRPEPKQARRRKPKEGLPK